MSSDAGKLKTGNEPGMGKEKQDDSDFITEELAGPSEEAGSSVHHLVKPEKTSPKLPNLSRANALLDAVAAISSQREVLSVAQEAAKQIAVFADADICTVSKWDQKSGKVVLWAEYRHGYEGNQSVPYLPYQTSDFPSTEFVLKTSTPFQIQADAPQIDEGEHMIMEGMDAKSLLMLPLFVQENTFGLIEIFEVKRKRVFSRDDILTNLVLANHAGISLDRAILLAEARQRASELEAIRQASLSLTASLDQEEVLATILKSVLRLSHDAMDAHIFLREDKELVFGAAEWAEGQEGEAIKKVRKGGLTDTVASTGERILVEDVTTHPLFQETSWVEKNSWKGGIIGIPLKVGFRVVGVMNIAYRQPQDFTEEKLRVLGLLADQAAITIVNARLHNLVQRQARTDPLTGLPNRRAFDERLDEEIKRSSRYNHPFALFMMDLDGFKWVNDSYGHLEGDKTLRLIGKTLMNTVRDTDFAARYGGDEFTLILPETVEDKAKLIADKITHAIESLEFNWPSDQGEFSFSISIGSAFYPSQAENAEDLVAAADAALYKVKQKKL